MNIVLTVVVCFLIGLMIIIESYVSREAASVSGLPTISCWIGVFIGMIIFIPVGLILDKGQPVAEFEDGERYKIVSISRVADQPSKALVGARNPEKDLPLRAHCVTFESVAKFRDMTLPIEVRVNKIGETIEFRLLESYKKPNPQNAPK
jgi:hypothetical protein